MFATKLFLIALSALSALYLTSALPTNLAPRVDWKTELGWDGKVTSPAELDPKNTVEATPSVRGPACAAKICWHVLTPVWQKRAMPGGVYYCTDEKFQGNCAYITGFNAGQCVVVGPDFNDKISSFGPDDGMRCTLFSDDNCNGRAVGGVTKPGIPKLSDFDMNDAMSSF
ncbi:hypothetical protein FRC12_018784, partial [Ceratobasidium sp. 428]